MDGSLASLAHLRNKIFRGVCVTVNCVKWLTLTALDPSRKAENKKRIKACQL